MNTTNMRKTLRQLQRQFLDVNNDLRYAVANGRERDQWWTDRVEEAYYLERLIRELETMLAQPSK